MKRPFISGIIILLIAATVIYAGSGNAMMGNMRYLMAWFGGQEAHVDLSTPRPPKHIETLRQGRWIYEQRCAECHGVNGDGKGRAAYDLLTKPRDFTRGVFKFRSTPTGSLPTDEDIYTTLSRGIRGTAMLPRFNLSSRDKWAVTYYIKTFSDRFDEEEPDEPLKIPEIANLDSLNLDRGRQLYEEAKCWECHGRDGSGKGPKADELKDDWGYQARPRSFVSGPFKRGANETDIFRSIATGLDGTPMSSYRDSMTDEDIFSLTTYVKSFERKAYRQYGGMMGMHSMTRDEQIGMMVDHHGSMGGGMMGRGMMMR